MGNHEISEEEPDAHLHVGHVDVLHHARHRYECHPGQRCPYHSESHDGPRRLSVSPEEGVIVLLLVGEPCHQQQDAEVQNNGQYDIESAHLL